VKKILLLSPKLNVKRALNHPLGLCYIQSYLKRETDHEVKMIDLHNVPPEKSKGIIEKENPDIVGISCLTANRMNSINLAKIAKEINPDITTILGGHHANFMYEQLLPNFPFVDYTVFGEGEITMTDLVQNLDHPEKVNGIAFMHNGKIIKTPQREISNLDMLPFPCYDDVDLKQYLGHRKFEKGKRRTGVITSRGCNSACHFCNESVFWRGWRVRSATSVVDELEWLVNNQGIEFVFFADDIFSIDEQRVIDICSEIRKRKLDLDWWCETRVDCVTERMLIAMRDSGCFIVEYGAESGSQKILDSINKKITVEQTRNAFNLTKKVGMMTEFLFMVGNPGETWDTIQETKDILAELSPDFLVGSVTYVYPATVLYNLAKKQGMIDDSYWLTDKLPPPYTGEHKIEELNAMYFDVIKSFHMSKGFFKWLEFGAKQFVFNPGNVTKIGFNVLKNKIRW